MTGCGNTSYKHTFCNKGADEAAAAVLKDMIALKVEPNLRLQRLLYRKPRKLAEAQLLALRRAVEYGQNTDAWAMFNHFDNAGYESN